MYRLTDKEAEEFRRMRRDTYTEEDEADDAKRASYGGGLADVVEWFDRTASTGLYSWRKECQKWRVKR